MAARESEPGITIKVQPSSDIELVNLPDSPTFPPRSPFSASPSPASPPSTAPPSPSSTPHHRRQGSDTTDSTLFGSQSVTKSDASSLEKTKRKRRLQFKEDILNLVTRKRTTSGSSTGSGGEDGRISPIKSPYYQSSGSHSPFSMSPALLPKGIRIPGTPSKSPRGSRRQTPDARYVTASGHYSVTAKDASVLERISQRAHKRAYRVMKPHEVFVEMEELRADSTEQQLEWEETARWIKFEEDVEEGTGRWGRPHISALAFHSLVDLRKGLENGCILLDVEGDDYPTIAREIIDYLVRSGQLPEESTEPVLQILLKKHKHNIDITLWEKLQNSARDGTLHHIGEGLRRITSSSHAALHELAVDSSGSGSGRGWNGNGNGKGMSNNHSGSFLRYRSHHHHAEEEKRTSVSPLLDGGMEYPESPSAIPQKRVVFNISNSQENLTSGMPGTSPGQASDANTTTHTESPLIRETSIDIEVKSASTSSKKNDKNDKETVDGTGPSPPLDRRHKNFSKNVLQLMEKIPEEAESLTVMVGGVKFLQKPVVAFVRLAQSHLLGDLTEVPLPVRFIYLLLGPAEGELDYHEIGRAMATLMSDKHFHEAAYSALTEDDLTDAIDEFLDGTIVLPPGDWDQDLLLPVMHKRSELWRKKVHKLQEAENRNLFAADALKHTRRPFGGMWHDLKSLVRRYPSDFRDALHIQVFVSMIFLFISLLAPAIAFGGIMEEVTGNLIGETETLVATGICGIVYGLFAVQPLTILAFTGPLLLMEEIVFDFSRDYSLPYLQWRACIGIWLMVILIIFAISESSFLVTYFSRFSEEVFTGVVVCFFIYEASKNTYDVYKRNPLCGINYPCGKAVSNTCVPLDKPYDNMTDNMTSDNMTMFAGAMNDAMSDAMNDAMNITMNVTMNITEASLPRGFRICNQPNTALWSTILALSTFLIAVFLRKLRQGKFLGKRGRRLVSDFGMLTAIATMVLVSYLLRDLIAVETLVVTRWTPSNPAVRDWFINPFDGSVTIGAAFGALPPALLVGILIFIENQLTVLVVNKAEHSLRKGVGYHFDLAIVAILAGVCGLFGMPWFCAAPVRSIQHVQALSVFSRKNAPGEKPKLLRVYEQRVTNIVIHTLIVLSPFAAAVLELIPVSVVLGVFFYLAYASISGEQLTSRIKLLITPPKHHPDVHYVRMTRTLKMHLYTIIQVFLVAGLFAIKLSPAAMVYPISIVFLVPVRKVMGKLLFTHTEMEALDCEEDFPEGHEEEGEYGEYKETNVPY